MAVSVSISASETAYSVANNTSTVKVTAKVTVSGESYNAYGMVFRVNCGTSSSNLIGQHSSTISVPKNSTKSYSYSYTVPHNADGSGQAYCWAQIATGISVGTVTKTKTLTLTKIPRASSFSAAAGTLGSAQTITVTRQDDSFTHTITYTCGTASGTICTKSTEESVSFTPSMDLASQNKTGQSVSVRFSLQTYSGSTAIGSAVTKTVAMAIPASVKPSCTVAVSDSTGYAQRFGGYVQGQSKALVTISPTIAYGAAITAYKTAVDGSTYTAQSFTTGVLTQSGEQTISTVVTDQRARTGEASEKITVLPYEKPVLAPLVVHRCDADGTENDRGSFAKITYTYSITPLSDQNEKSAVLYYKRSADAEYQSMTLESVYEASGTDIIIPAEDSSSYDLMLEVTDAFGSVQSTTSISTGFTMLHFNSSGKGLGIGKVSEHDGLSVGMDAEFDGTVDVLGAASFAEPVTLQKTMQVQGKANMAGGLTVAGKELLDLMYPIGSIYLSVSSVNPQTIFGGTWEPIQDRFLLAAGSSYAAGSTGGSATVSLSTANLPAHTHELQLAKRQKFLSSGTTGSYVLVDSTDTTSTNYAPLNNGTTTSAGSGTAHNNMPPYLAVYVWKRTA